MSYQDFFDTFQKWEKYKYASAGDINNSVSITSTISENVQDVFSNSLLAAYINDALKKDYRILFKTIFLENAIGDVASILLSSLNSRDEKIKPIANKIKEDFQIDFYSPDHILDMKNLISGSPELILIYYSEKTKARLIFAFKDFYNFYIVVLVQRENFREYNINPLVGIFKEYFQDNGFYKPHIVNIELISQGVNGGISSITISRERNQLVKNIFPEFFLVDPEKFLEAYMQSNDSLVIFYGAPGTGKSKFISYIISLVSKAHIIKGIENIANFNQITKLIYKKLFKLDEEFSPFEEDDEFSNFYDPLNTLVKNGENDKKPTPISSSQQLYIFDDFDYLSKRDNSGQFKLETDMLSNLLALTDGIFDLKPKIIISTNIPLVNIDEALLRPGRTFDVIEFKALDVEYADSKFQEIINKYPEENEVLSKA